MLGCGYHRSHTRHWFFVDHGFIIVLLFFHYFPVYVQEWSFSVLASPRYLEIFSTHLYSSLLIIYDTWLSDYSISLVYSLFFSSFVSFQLLSGPLHVWCLWSHIGNTYHFPLLHFHSLLSCSMWLLWPAILILFLVTIGFDGEKIQANPFLEHFRFAEFDLDAD